MTDDLVNREELGDGIVERMEQFLRDYAALQGDKSQPILPSPALDGSRGA